MSVYWWALRLIQSFEDHIVASILRRPGFHRAVGKIHKTINEKQYGRNPHEPLAPGEATGQPSWVSGEVMMGLMERCSGSKLERSTSKIRKTFHRRVEESV
ncbi:hypothetical protein CEP51_002784 [Fusarium floridanum]|uniref:Uncharacterized protein n=1 Tax=Fusarium floridanum TaxID=1325733 RepID=A0A428S9B4_9HYPO|nr:hypothetical protein CEP51_002784 [Fusarium floridanum]